MRRLKKKYFLSIFCTSVLLLGAVRWINDMAADSAHESAIENDSVLVEPSAQMDTMQMLSDVSGVEDEVQEPYINNVESETQRKPHPIYSVPSFSRTFPDLQSVQIESARKLGVKPVRNRHAAEERKSELVYVGSNPYFCIDEEMTSSIPFLVPRAAEVLEMIARNYLDSLYVKGIPMHKILVSSVLRTEEDVERLRKINVNASPESCHRYGTTFDIPYNRYYTVMPPDATWPTTQNDTLKWVLAEVLRDVREAGHCYIKYEVKQGCFHITAR